MSDRSQQNQNLQFLTYRCEWSLASSYASYHPTLALECLRAALDAAYQMGRADYVAETQAAIDVISGVAFDGTGLAWSQWSRWDRYYAEYEVVH